ncbi:hypothetical protein AAFC00_005212 [Neodothiora populina]|uniref:F-box domain-containing protein n=1 Tax=Neodothiora populina TaxID=2781224 RepID=A0ABR3PK61_9PEZI
MGKRRASDTSDEAPVKRWRPSHPDHLSSLSHELILRVLSHLSVPDLIGCQSLSHRFHTLAGDSQLWKALYYNRFVRPRAARLPGIRGSGVAAESLYFSSKSSKWLDDESLVQRGKETNWKKQYKTRHNWTKGTCAMSEVPVAEEPSVPPVLVQMHESTIYMVDQHDGLRAWSDRAGHKKLADIALHHPDPNHRLSPPSALAVNTSTKQNVASKVAVGFQDGSFSIYELNADATSFTHLYSHEPSSNGMLSAMALSYPHVASMTANQLLSFYKFDTVEEKDSGRRALKPPRLLQSLHSRTVWPPMTLSIRPSSDNILVSIAYALPTYLSGWTVGIQELHVATNGELKESRLASAIDQHYRPLALGHSTIPASQNSSLSTAAFGHFGTSEANQIHSKPTSLSYTHPYLLVSHPDNTLTLYLVSSTASALTISPGNRLWGHTSSVSGAHVGGRGKAVSVSKRGDELRIWELEGGFASAAARRRLAAGELSVQLRPEARSTSNTDALSSAIAARGNGLGLALEHRFDETSMTRGWVGFDDERVVVLKEKSCGGQALVVYDFT